MVRVMDQRILGYGRGGAVGVFLGHIVYMIFNGDDPRSIIESAAMSAVVGVLSFCLSKVILSGGELGTPNLASSPPTLSQSEEDGSQRLLLALIRRVRQPSPVQTQ